MEQTTTVAAASETLDRLARLEPSSLPVLSLYLDLRPNSRGRDDYAAFVRKELKEKGRTYPLRSQERESFDQDAERIQKFLATEVSPSSNGLAIFACAGAGLFEAISLDAPFEGHRFSVSQTPHLFPLARLIEENPLVAVVLAESHAARLFVFGLGRTLHAQTVTGQKVNHSSVGGWSQMRYQRHVEKLQKDHAQELAQALERAVREEGIDRIVLAGDEVNVPLMRSVLSEELSRKVVDVLKLETRTPEQEVMRAAAEALRRHDAKSDAEVVERVLGDYRAGGLAVAGAEETRKALANGQVEELYLSAKRDPDGDFPDVLVASARQTSASIRFIEDPELLASVDGVAAALRYRPGAPPQRKGQEIS